MATASKTMIARAVTDSDDRLLTADDPLAELQERCGGQIPGALAIPELLALVRKSRAYGLRLSRRISAYDGDATVSAIADVIPIESEDGAGCEIALDKWQREEAEPDSANTDAARIDTIDRDVAEFSARLDSRQRVLTASAGARDLTGLEQAMEQGRGHDWTKFVELKNTRPDIASNGPLHWRLLDGSRCRIDGSERDWTARLLPLGTVSDDPGGFELLLLADQPLAHLDTSETSNDIPLPRLLGRELTPALRKPISSIIANAETIRTRLAGPLADEYADYAADISSAGQHLLSLLEDLADLEVVEDPAFSTAPDHINPADLARRAAAILGGKAKAKQITITLPPEDASCAAVGEQRRVLQILLNLIGNAINYSPEGSTIALSVDIGATGPARITVSDDGPGLNAEQQAKIFAKFERLGRDGDGGSGLGLYISQRLAAAMGGSLEVASTRGEGAKFTLSLPRD